MGGGWWVGGWVVGGWVVRNTGNKAQLRLAEAGALPELGKISASRIFRVHNFRQKVRDSRHIKRNEKGRKL